MRYSLDRLRHPVREWSTSWKVGYHGDELNILSWNINGLSSEKKESSDFEMLYLKMTYVSYMNIGLP